MTQQERILNYIKMFGSISPIEAFTDLGITKLATRVSEMRKEGIAITGEMESARNRFGDKVHYMRYSLEAKK